MRKRIFAAGFAVALAVVFVASTAVTAFAADSQSFSGVVSDSMCGAKHAMAGDAASCTKACVEHGADYALVVGDKVYTLDGNKDELGKYAGKPVTVKGALDGSKIKVESVKPAKS